MARDYNRNKKGNNYRNKNKLSFWLYLDNMPK